MRGHHVEAHNYLGMGELASMFLQNSHKGLVACLPFAELMDDQQHKLLYHHWTWSLSGLRLPAASLDAARLSIQPVVRRSAESINQDSVRQRVKEEAHKKRNSREDPDV